MIQVRFAVVQAKGLFKISQIILNNVFQTFVKQIFTIQNVINVKKPSMTGEKNNFEKWKWFLKK